MAKMYIKGVTDMRHTPFSARGKRRITMSFCFDNTNREKSIDFVFTQDESGNTKIVIYRNRNMGVIIDTIPTEF